MCCQNACLNLHDSSMVYVLSNFALTALATILDTLTLFVGVQFGIFSCQLYTYWISTGFVDISKDVASMFEALGRVP